MQVSGDVIGLPHSAVIPNHKGATSVRHDVCTSITTWQSIAESIRIVRFVFFTHGMGLCGDPKTKEVQ
jgi:hypothetical protein